MPARDRVRLSQRRTASFAMSRHSLAGFTVLYGGSFDPPHIGHQMACLYLLEALDAFEIWLLPACGHPFGKQLLDFDERVAMCRLLAAPFGDRVLVSEIERRPGGSGRTYDTLEHLTTEHPNHRFALAIGSDIVQEVHLWHRWPELQRLAEVVVVGRQGYPDVEGAEVLLPAVSSSNIRRRLAHAESIEGHVPVSVQSYIASHNLYA